MWWVHRFTQKTTDWFTSSPVHRFTSSPKVTILHTPVGSPAARSSLVGWSVGATKKTLFRFNLNGLMKSSMLVPHHESSSATRKKNQPGVFATLLSRWNLGTIRCNIIFQTTSIVNKNMISTAMDGLTRRRGARIEEERERQRYSQRVTGKQRLDETILPIPVVAIAMSGAIFILASLFVVWYHLFYDDEDD